MAKRGALLFTVLLGAATYARAANAVTPHRSETTLPSSNGRGAIAFDATTYRITQFMEHAYRYPTAGQQTRNFAYDSYPGVRVGTASHAWLSAIAPALVEYVEGTNIIHVVRDYAGVTFDEYDLAPMSLGENASVMLVKATRTSGSGVIDVYSIFNYHLGSGGPLPGTDGEQITYDATQDAYYESGPSGVAFAYGNIGASSHHGCSPQNPYDSLNAGANLADDPGTGGPTTDAVAGLQATLGDIPLGASAWAGGFTVLASDAQGAAASARVRAWLNGRTPDKILSDEVAAWNAWVTAPPSGASTLEASIARNSQVALRSAQVTEAGGGTGQILASIAPGQWNISWVRDMSYATVALARSGHYAEAKAALAFQMTATTGAYRQYVGSPYQISVVRYFGNGTEESDSNANGPNIEFDGFGLFLWSLDEYVKASGDTASLGTWWPVVKQKVADVLVKLQETSGLISADSSIWEVHWNGQQRHFAYTTITAANGLCSAARLADRMSDATSAATYRMSGGRARDAILAGLRAPDGTLVQSTEGLAAGTGWLDAAVIEALNFGLIDPARHTAAATLRSIKSGLVPQSGRGFMRSDAGDSYSSNEWVFIDLRASRALALQGDTATSTSGFAWNVDQASENFGEMSELHDPVMANYAGQSPMVGFGAGAYLLALYDRGAPLTPTCDMFASEPANPADAGTDAEAPGSDAGEDGGHGVGTDAGGVIDAGMTQSDGGMNFGVDSGRNAAADGGSPSGFGDTGSSSGCSISRPPGADDDAQTVFILFGIAALAMTGGRRRA